MWGKHLDAYNPSLSSPSPPHLLPVSSPSPPHPAQAVGEYLDSPEYQDLSAFGDGELQPCPYSYPYPYP